MGPYTLTFSSVIYEWIETDDEELEARFERRTALL